MSKDTSSQSNTSPDLVGEAQVLAGKRSELYALFAQALIYPDDALCDWIRSGELSNALRETLDIVAPSLCEPSGTDWTALASCGENDALSVEYTRLFDAGVSGPPCPLYGGLYGETRMKDMEECVRFYNYFGLKLSEEQRELPDHLVTQLEFLHVLGFREVEALQQDRDPAAFRRAQRDFIIRHPGAWLPRLCAQLEEQNPDPFFSTLLGLLDRLFASESLRLAATP